MNPALKDKVLRILLVPIGLFVVLVPVSTLLGWNLITAVGYWFVAVPVVSFLMPKRIGNRGTHLMESLSGLVLFYAFMVFMIYEHFTSDFFVMMMASLAFNVIMIAVTAAITRRKLVVHP